ncbi:hypothetical protein GE21DRAFT_1215059 [Neurospora crassa]|nr:hypothetical protein GE21DRAFT_1215059 [Neurospora crassa]
MCQERLEGRHVKFNFGLMYEERQWEGNQETKGIGNVWGCLGGGRRGWISMLRSFTLAVDRPPIVGQRLNMPPVYHLK